MPSQLCTQTAKTRAMAPEAPTLSNYTAGPLVKMLGAVLIGLAPYLDKFLMTSNFCGTLTEKPTFNRFLDSFV
jgi:hypothetical protein